MKDELIHNGVPVVFEVRLVTERGEGWKGMQSVAVCETIEEVNKVIYDLEVPAFWMIDIQLQDKYPEVEYPEPMYGNG